MNYHLFSAYLLITLVLVVVPGPIVTLVIATGASRGIRTALMTVAGTTLGNAVLLAGIAFGLNDSENLGGSVRSSSLDRRGLLGLAGHSGMAARRRKR